MLSPEVQKLDGRTVLVRTVTDDHNPPIARRGTIRVVPENEERAGYIVELVMEFPDMFNQPAHQRVVQLNQHYVQDLLVAETNGAHEFTIDVPLDAPVGKPERVPPDTLVSH